MPKYDCISIGNSTVDLILKSKDFKIVKNSAFTTGTAICEIFDSKVNVDELNISSGGGATNTSCALAHFGLKTSCISKLGTDSLSEIVIDDLTKFKVDFESLDFVKGEKTPISVILTPFNGVGRTAMAYRPKAFTLDLLSIKNKHFDSEYAYLTNLGLTFLNSKNVIDFLKQKNIKVAWNPGLNELENVELSFMPNIDVFILNIEEASKLSGLAIEKTSEIVKFFISKVKCPKVLITMGEKGAFYVSREEIYHIASYKVEVENTIGAGDAFGSGFMYALIKGMKIEQCLEYGMKNAACVVQKIGAKENFMKNLSELPAPKIQKIK